MDTQRLFRLLGIFTAACLLTTPQGFRIDMPASVKAVEGGCVLVPCQTQPHDRVIWYKYKSMGWPVIYDAQNPGNVIDEFRGRSSVPGHPSEGNCTLRINNVRMSDDITLFPYINPESDKYYHPTVQIKAQSRMPPVILGPSSVKEGETFNISCSIQHSCPPNPPSIEWRGLPGITTGVSTERNDAGMWVTVATVTATATHHQHSKKIQCSSLFSNDRATESQPLTLNIFYAPVNVTLYTTNHTVAEHDTVTLRCESKSNPAPLFHQWFINNGHNSSQVNSSSNYINITDIQRKFSAACVSHNTIGDGRSVKTSLDVAFVSIILPDSSCSKTDKKLRCVCWVEAHPIAVVTWMLNGSTDLPASVISNVTMIGNVRSSELVLERELAEQWTVVCVANNSYSTDTHQMTIKDGKVSLPTKFLWIILAGAFGFLILYGLICFCKYTRQREPTSLAGSALLNTNMGRQNVELKATAKRTGAQKPEEDKMCNFSSACAMALDSIYDNDAFIQTQMIPQKEDTEEIYLNSEDAEKIYLNC